MSIPVIFDGQVPKNYEEFLTPFLFDPFALDLAERINFGRARNILELACGTGCVTGRLAARLKPGAKLTATDLQNDMLEIARAKINDPKIVWQTVDMTGIPFGDRQFDSVVCQFGLMLVPDKQKAVREMYRVLKKGGRLLFNVWGAIEKNAVWKLGGEVIEKYFGANPIMQNPGPFAMSTGEEAYRLIDAAGFANVGIASVVKEGSIDTAARAAEGFIQGLPMLNAIKQKDPALVPQIIEALELELKKQLGDRPLRSPLNALVFEAEK